jgi:PilZ domain-containing protein
VSTVQAGRPSEQNPDARSAPRLQASAVPAITGVRLSPFGAEATLVNISQSGVLVECATRLRLGTALTVVFDGTFTPSSVEGRVARSSVASVDKKGTLRYHVGIAFTKPIALNVPVKRETQPQTETAQTPAAAAQPAAAPAIANRW